MGADVPKQYLALAGRTVVEHAIERACAHPWVCGAVVALAASDRWFEALPVAARVERAAGGAERADSVRNALDALASRAGERDRVLVHDAVRPCLHPDDLDRVIREAHASEDGALLGTPVRDTMKRVSGGRVAGTVARESLWHALTPQVFPLGALRQALERAARDGVTVTDESQAMERAGYRPRVVPGRSDNLQITRPEDLDLAAFFLSRSERAA